MVSELVWVVECLDDIRSDMSRFHRVDEVEHMTADRFFSFASRLGAYGGVLAHKAQKQVTQRESTRTESPEPQSSLKDVRELMATDPLYQGLITAVQVPSSE